MGETLADRIGPPTHQFPTQLLTQPIPRPEWFDENKGPAVCAAVVSAFILGGGSLGVLVAHLAGWPT